MINLSTSGNAVVFTFTDSDRYLYGSGTITVPLNSLLLVTDSSNMATFKKAASNDVFVSALYSELGMTKDELISWFETNAVGSTGGGGGITSGEVESMIVEAVSGKADSSAVTQDIATATADMATKTWVGQQGYLTEHQSLSAYSTTVEMDNAIDAAVSVKLDASAYTPTVVDSTFDSGSTNPLANSAITDHLNTVESVIATSLVDLDNRKLDVSAYTPTDLSNYYTSAQTESAITAAVSGKVNTSAIVTAVTSASTDSEIPSAKAVYDAIPTGGTGASYTAGRGIAIDTANTISFDLPISADSEVKLLAGTGNTYTYATNNIIIGNSNTAKGTNSGRVYSGGTIIGYGNTVGCTGTLNTANTWSTIIGKGNKINGGNSYIIGLNNNFEGGAVYKRNFTYVFGRGNGENAINSDSDNIFVFGAYNKVSKSGEFALGMYNASSKDNTTSGNTFFSIGNGTADNARHNAFEIRQNGDIYCSNGTSDVKVQDYLQYKMAKVTQAEYDALVQAGTVDASTVYFITNSNS